MMSFKKRFGLALLDATPHICLILSLMHVVFLIVDLFNRAMAFVNNDITKWLLLVSAIFTLILCSDLHVTAKDKKRPLRVGIRVCTIAAVLTVFVFILDHETKIINTTVVKYLFYIYSTTSASLSVYGIIHRRNLLKTKYQA